MPTVLRMNSYLSPPSRLLRLKLIHIEVVVALSDRWLSLEFDRVKRCQDGSGGAACSELQKPMSDIMEDMSIFIYSAWFQL